MVCIYLKVQNQQVLALSVPYSDIARLSVRPVKWLRFVTFAICGVRGDLSSTPNGLPVDYDSISIAGPISEAYYYTPEGDYCFIDYNALNDRITSEYSTTCSQFHSGVMARDGPICVFTGGSTELSDAAHLLPKSKGDEYIGVVLQDRLHLYHPSLESQAGIFGINSVENGIYLRKDLHAAFGVGFCAFLKTPNFALDPADIPRVEMDSMPLSRITLHHLVPEPHTSRATVPQGDALIAGTGVSPPSTIILDFMYGVAAYRRWGSGAQDIQEVMQHRFAEHYQPIPIPPASLPSDSDSSPESDNLDDKYKPKSNKRRRGRNYMSDEMARAMDNVLALSMLLKGTTSESTAKEIQRREEVEESRAKEASKVKVQEWLQSPPNIEFPSNASQTMQLDAEHIDE